MTATLDLDLDMDTAEDPSLTRPKACRRHSLVSNHPACLVHIYPTGPWMGSRYPLGDEPLTLGRSPDCGLRLDDCSVSRRHVQLEPDFEGYRVVDLGSTNGTFINDRPVSRSLLKDGDYLRIGNSIFRFLASGNIEADYHEEIYRLTIIDALTGAHNKRYLLESLEREVSRAVRHRRPLALILFDIDYFKRVNDELGHLAGDFFLRELAGRVRTAIHPEDLFARFGGEEFALVLVETRAEEAIAVAEQLRQQVASTPFLYRDARHTVTISLGVAAFDGTAPLTVGELLRQADDKLYQAKRGGRNRLVA